MGGELKEKLFWTPESCSNACLCLGCCGTCCCPVGKERYCSCFNHCCCCGQNCMECCPCGAQGCLGIPTHLCNCCGNCNLMCYADCCPLCSLADLHIATIKDPNQAKGEWATVVCTLVTLFIVSEILLGFCPNRSGCETWQTILQTLGSIVELFLGIYVLVIFGTAATRVSKAKGFQYEPAECFESCCQDQCCLCCTSCTCCCTYWCCSGCHYMQVMRTIEGTDMEQNIMNGRPEQCKCCNCWQGASNEGGNTGTGTGGVDRV